MANDFSNIYLTREPLVIPPQNFSSTAGAVIDFYGVVRGLEGEHAISGLEYETFGEMAEAKLRQIAGETGRKYDLETVFLIHRVGFVAVGEASLFLRVSAGHRGEGLTATREIIERLKMEVPIWKNPVNTLPL